LSCLVKLGSIGACFGPESSRWSIKVKSTFQKVSGAVLNSRRRLLHPGALDGTDSCRPRLLPLALLSFSLFAEHVLWWIPLSLGTVYENNLLEASTVFAMRDKIVQFFTLERV